MNSTSLTSLRTRVNKELAELNIARRRCRDESEALTAAEARVRVLQEAQTLAQQAAQVVQEQAHQQITRVVTQCLEAVFDEPYTFKIHFERKRGRTEARLVFERDGLEIDPLTASGGGVVDVAAFALRLSCLMLTRPPVRRMLVLDEPFKFVSAMYRPRIKDLLETLAKDTGVQILMVTHMDELKAGKVVDLSLSQSQT